MSIARASGTFEVLIGMEGAAFSIKEFEIVAIPGLLQTREYADSLLSVWMPEDPERRYSAVEIRMRRQRILSGPDVPQVSVVLDEAALHRLVGGAAVMRKQLEHLIDLIDRGVVEIRVIPFRAGAHVGMLKRFHVIGVR